MKRNSIVVLVLSIVIVVGFQTASAQFPIKIPKMPKVEKPNAEQPKTGGDSSTLQTQPTKQSGGGFEFMMRPEPTSEPVFLKDTVEIKVKSQNRYWKVPNQDYYTSWLPQVSFDLFFDNSTKMRYVAEWLNPDGSVWFSEPLNFGTASYSTVGVSSSYSVDNFNTKASVATGTYGVRLLNSKSNEVIFQGKFKVEKSALSPGDARRKNEMMFYVDNDWSLPVGFVGFNYTGNTSWDYDPKPIVFMWFKGNLDGKLFEARLFHNNQEVATTDDGGFVNFQRSRGEDCFQSPEICRYHLWEFNWDRFIVENEKSVREGRPNATFTRDKPGEYTVKIFYSGTQVREAKFTIDNKGWIARNDFSKQIYLSDLKIVVPVKVMGNIDKWNRSRVENRCFLRQSAERIYRALD